MVPATNVTSIEIKKTAPAELDEQVEWYWVAKAANGEIVATSETYTRLEDASRAARDTFPGIEQEKQ